MLRVVTFAPVKTHASFRTCKLHPPQTTLSFRDVKHHLSGFYCNFIEDYQNTRKSKSLIFQGSTPSTYVLARQLLTESCRCLSVKSPSHPLPWSDMPSNRSSTSTCRHGKLHLFRCSCPDEQQLFRCVLTELRVDETTQSPWRTDTSQACISTIRFWHCIC